MPSVFLSINGEGEQLQEIVEKARLLHGYMDQKQVLPQHGMKPI